MITVCHNYVFRSLQEMFNKGWRSALVPVDIALSEMFDLKKQQKILLSKIDAN